MKNIDWTIAWTLFLFGCGAGSSADHPTEKPSAPVEYEVAPDIATTWTFDEAETGRLPEDWKVEGTNQRGPVATWMVQADANASSESKILVLTDTKKGWGGTFNLAWTGETQFQDGVIEVKVKAGTGEEDQGGGPIWRVQDKDNYYIARWNPLEDNFRLYTVKEGSRKTLESLRIKVDPTTWHTIRIEHLGEKIRCFLDGEALDTAHDDTFPAGGGVGLWTKADAITSFDDLSVQPWRIKEAAP